jgi:biofilm PGA synthesis protein PgaD
MKDLIIDKPQWQSARQRMLFGSLTTLFWVLWIYLWLPVLAIAGWILGLKIGYDEMVVRAGYASLARLLKVYALIIGCLDGTLLAWAYYNYYRFRGVERRKRSDRVTLADLARRYGIAPRILERWTHARRLVVHHSTGGHIAWAEVSRYHQAVPRPEIHQARTPRTSAR